MKIPLSRCKQLENECGPAALKSVLDYYNINVQLDDLTTEVSGQSPIKWRNWFYAMGSAALQRGLKAKVITLTTTIFDPTWYRLDKPQLLQKLKAELKVVQERLNTFKARDPYYFWHIPSYELAEIKAAISFIEHGGTIIFEPISKEKIFSYLRRRIPLLCGINPVLLHKIRRLPNDVSGSAWGHIVTVSGYTRDKFWITDPSDWYAKKQIYQVDQDRLIESILRNDQQLLAVYQ